MTYKILLSILIVCILLHAVSGLIVAERGDVQPRNWIIVGDAKPTDAVNFKILITQRNLDLLDATFWEVSDPTHINYGKFLTKEKIHDMVAPDAATYDRIIKWLQNSGVPAASVRVVSDFIKVQTNVEIASALFNTQFSEYTSLKSGHTLVRIRGRAYIPDNLKPDIDFITGLSELIDSSLHNAKFWPKNQQNQKHHNYDPVVTPNMLRDYYKLGDTRGYNTTNNLQGIASYSDYFSEGALEEFYRAYNLSNPIYVSTVGHNCQPDSCDGAESDLDMQYITSMGLGVNTVFINHVRGEWVLDFAHELVTMTNPPLVSSMSYGFPELDQCYLDTSCSVYGYDSVEYMYRSEVELQKVGVRGITVLVSSGDDGAPTFDGASGNCPLDPNFYCPLGKCEHTSSQCPSVTLISANNTKCFYPQGMESDACLYVLGDSTSSNLSAVIDLFKETNAECFINYDVDVWGWNHMYSACPCSKLKTVKKDGYTLGPYEYLPENGPLFSAQYPTTSRYVTSVGATQFIYDDHHKPIGEQMCSVATGAMITGGGGFSTFLSQPSYQAAAVAGYLKSGVPLPPSYSFNPHNRAFPDVAFAGHNFDIYESTNIRHPDKCPCKHEPVDGTSCSSPSFAGILSLVNDKLLNAGKPQIGFANPLLYTMAAEHPAAFNDVTMGTNACSRNYCCKYGYLASPGWDPATGLGSPNFPEFSSYILKLKGVKN
jgi:subtilase family serine protease